MKNVKETTRLFRYDLNQILNDYTMGMMNRFKGLDLVGKVPEELWMEVCNIVREAVATIIQRKLNERRQRGCLRRLYKYPRKEEK